MTKDKYKLIREIVYDYTSLRALIIEKYGSYGNFAEELEMYQCNLSRKLCNYSQFTQDEIRKIKDLLEIPDDLIVHYFFTLNV